MNVMRILAGLASLVLTAGLAGGLASSAQASAVPVIYNNTNGWMTPQVRPNFIYIGQGGAPIAHTWSWNTWSSKAARSTCTLWVDNNIPDAARGKTSYHKLYATLSGVKWHNGRAYYSVMTWYTPGYRTFGSHGSTLVLHFGILSGATMPGWN